MQSVTPIDAPCLCDHVGTLAVAVNPTGGEKSPVSALSPRSAREDGDDRWGRVVSGGLFEMDFSIFRNG